MSEDAEDDSYGWVLVCACFIIGLMTVDCSGSFGIFMIESVERGYLSDVYVTLIGAARFSLAGLCGIVLGGLAHKYGQKRVMIAGSLLVFLGQSGCALWPHLGFFWIFFTYGLVSSIGYGCYCLVFGTAFQDYFKRRLGLANAIVTTGYSCGVFFWPPVLEMFLSTYGWTGGLLLDAALHLHGIALALLIVPKKLKRTQLLVKDYVLEDSDLAPNYIDATNGQNSTKGLNMKVDKNKQHTYVSLPDLSQHLNDVSDEQRFGKCKTLSLDNSVHKVQPVLQYSDVVVEEDNYLHSKPIKKPTCEAESSGDVIAMCKTPNCDLHKSMKEQNSKCAYVLDYFSKMKDFTDFTLLKYVPFLMYSVGMAMVQGGGLAPVALLPTKAVEEGITKVHAALLVSIMGISNALTKLIWGFLADVNDREYYKPLLCGVPAVLSGIVSFLSVVAKDYVSLGVFACIWGILSAGYSSLQFTLVVQLLNRRNINKGVGTLQTLMGVSWTLCFLISGLLMEFYSGIILPFFALGAIQVVGGAFIVAIPLAQRRHTEQAEHG